MRYNEKRARDFSKRPQLRMFPSKFSRFRAFWMLSLPKRNVALMVFTENKLFYFSKRALLVGTTCNKWLKEALFLLVLLFRFVTSCFQNIKILVTFLTSSNAGWKCEQCAKSWFSFLIPVVIFFLLALLL